MLPLTFTDIDTDHGLLSQWGEMARYRRSLHGPLSLYHSARARCEGGDLMRLTTCWKICSEASGGERRDSQAQDNEDRL